MRLKFFLFSESILSVCVNMLSEEMGKILRIRNAEIVQLLCCFECVIQPCLTTFFSPVDLNHLLE